MNVKETLTILSEEAAEVIQANSKLIRFGPYDEDNVKKLEKEQENLKIEQAINKLRKYLSEEN